MKLAETVTFGGSGFDRAGELRGDPEAVARAAADHGARALALWRGKPLLQGGATLVRLPLGHPVFGGAALRVLLGREDGQAIFAFDLSHWTPADLDASELGAFLDPSVQHHPALPDDMGFAELRACMTALSPRDAELAATAKAIIGWHATHGFCAKCGAASDIGMAGWQRICPDCKGHHFPRTDPVVIMLITHGNDALLGRSPGWPEGMYSLLAGFVEPGETIEAAVRRETFEEAGIRVGPVRYLASQPWAFPSSLMFGCQGDAASRDITLDPVEIEDALWVSRERLMSVFAGEDSAILPARRGAIAHFILQNWLADTLD